MPALTAVLDAIARAVLGDAGDVDGPAVSIGTMTLRSHQRDALSRIRASIERTGGALLADEPGLGKTLVALALAREYEDRMVVAPAALRAMWRGAAAAGVGVRFVSLETLSRRDVHAGAHDGLVIVDEARHARNPSTARYARLARLVSHRRVLLLSATPVLNRRAELATLLALFMGPRAHLLDDAERSRCIVRRGGDAALRPAIDGPDWHRVRGLPRLRHMIAALPPPLPALDGRQATALLGMTLARCWASSLAALDAALQRRLQRGAALRALLDDGRLPTRAELRAWVVGDDAVQLAFPIIASHETPDAALMRPVLDAHLEAVRAMRARVQPRVEADALQRARLLLDLRRTHAGARIVAFTAHAATAEALYRALRRERGVALLTSKSARTAGGTRPRADVIDALGAHGASEDAFQGESSRCARARDEISLVITTDLLSEGVNLQGASVVVHLDVPWTPAGLDQRVGRAARMGSRHARVHVHGIAPPAAAERLLALDRRLRRKRAEQAEAARAPREIEQLRAIVASWRSGEPCPGSASGLGPAVASVPAARAGFIAVVETRGEVVLVCGAPRGRRRWSVGDSPGSLLDLARAVGECGARSAEQDPALEASARVAIDRWLARRRGRESSGAAVPPSRARRRLLAHLDGAMRRAGVHARAALAERIAHTRALIGQAISAGAERELEQIARKPSNDLESLLGSCEARLAGGTLPVASDAGAASPAGHENHVVRALLLLRRPA